MACTTILVGKKQALMAQQLSLETMMAASKAKELLLLNVTKPKNIKAYKRM